MHRSKQDWFARSVPRLTKSEEVGGHAPKHGAEGDPVGTPFWKVEEGTVSGRSAPEAETEGQTRTSARAACCPGGIACRPLCSEQGGSAKRQKQETRDARGPTPALPSRLQTAELQISKLCRLAVIPQGQLLPAVGTSCPLGSAPQRESCQLPQPSSR
ncbi:hypothetical protein HJG60_011121 [Phyllostomus discolor]|uniref:Uncharacterized protein n=1 Tax=Phyllostomus discolor TaxID=89673 RepID=A0A834A3W2_9CHIR|nr:hypothetical protein HJG60_011121 [Phyllostomus discolor]